jgi:hypothetical protein
MRCIIKRINAWCRLPDFNHREHEERATKVTEIYSLWPLWFYHIAVETRYFSSPFPPLLIRINGGDTLSVPKIQTAYYKTLIKTQGVHGSERERLLWLFILHFHIIRQGMAGTG